MTNITYLSGVINVIIADDHRIFIDGINALLSGESGIRLTGQAQNGQEVLQMLQTEKADVVILDINMPVLNGIETTRKIKEDFPNVNVLILSMYNEKSFISNALEAGASGYILKNADKDEFVTAIQSVAAGKAYYGNEVTSTIMESLKDPEAGEKKLVQVDLSSRELEVLQLIAKGLNNNEIAEELFISSHTVKSHRKKLMSKIDVKNTAGLVMFAVEHSLLE